MEERLTDEPIKLDSMLDGEPEGEETYDEDLVGLTPERLDEELEKRRLAEEKARAEYEKLMSSAKERMDAEDFAGAEGFYKQAMLYERGVDAEEGVWAARTANFTSTDPFYQRRTAVQFAEADEEVREKVLAKLGPKLHAQQAEYEAEAEPLREKVEAGMESRRSAFAANRDYYLKRFLLLLPLLVAFGVTCAVCASYIVRTKGMTMPIVTIVFGALTFLWLIVVLVFARKLYAAERLVLDNEKRSSTEDGIRLDYLETRLRTLAIALNVSTEETLEAEEEE